MQAGQRGNQMGTRFWEMVCDEHGIGSGGEYFGGNDAHLGRFNVFYHGALGGKYVPRAALFDFEPGVIEAFRAFQLDWACPEGFKCAPATRAIFLPQDVHIFLSSST